MAFTVTLTTTCDPARRRVALSRAYDILLRVSETKTADPGNFGEEQGPAAGKSPHFCGDDDVNSIMIMAEGATIGRAPIEPKIIDGLSPIEPSPSLMSGCFDECQDR